MQRGQQDRQSKQQQKCGEVLILGSDSGTVAILYSKLEEICLRNKKKEKPVFFLLLLLFFFQKRFMDLQSTIFYFRKYPATTQQHNNTLGTPIHCNGHTFG